MADVSFTATSFKESSTSITLWGTAGATITRGKAVYLDTSDNEYKVADCTGASTDAAVGFALTDSADGQKIKICTGGDITCDGLTAGTVYILSASGAICPAADLNLTTDYLTVMGASSSATNLKVPTTGPIVTAYKTP